MRIRTVDLGATFPVEVRKLLNTTFDTGEEKLLEQPDELAAVAVIREVWLQNVYRLRPEMLAGGWVVDVGASFGAFTVLALEVARATGQYGEQFLAIEPDVDSMELLIKNTRAVQCPGVGTLEVHLDERAVWQPGGGHLHGTGPEARLTETYTTDGEALVAGVAAGLRGEGRPLPVPTATLQTIVDEHLADVGEIDVLKLDCEGAEHRALLDSPSVVERCRWIVMEWSPGVRMRDHADLLELVSCTHALQTIGNAAAGGYLWAHRFDV